jgi:limonene-1,2-epoxide hydrolase
MTKDADGLDRRAFLAATGLGVGSFGFPVGAAAQTTESEKANLAVVNRFLHLRWNATPIDYNALRELLAEDCVRAAADPTSNLEKGRDTILNNLKQRAGDGAPTRFTHIVQQWASGPIVTHERYEGNGGVGRDGQPAAVGHGIGVFHVQGGKIKEWRFYQIESGPNVKVPARGFKP